MKKLIKNEWIAVTVAVVALSLIVLIPSPRLPFFDQLFLEDLNSNTMDTTSNELHIIDQVVGEGAEVKNGDKVAVHYSGTLTDGTVFDSSVTRGTPFEFVVGAGMVIAGWEQGVLGMKVGGKRSLTIPPSLAYGEAGIGPIPGGATIMFSIELLKIGE